MNAPSPWVGTYRLQLTPSFTFADAAGVMGYLARLGVSHAYLSPIFEARRGSTHGYDGTDPTRIRDELGGPEGFGRLAEQARRFGLGILLDIVPNHLAAHDENPWWWDVLRRGAGSEYAPFFDIDWDAGGGRVVLPVLGTSPQEAAEAGELVVARGSEGAPYLRYLEHRFPLAEETDGSADREGASVLSRLERQHYRLAHWRETGAALNYRRFFDITDLVGLRVEDERVFDAVHAGVLALVGEGLIDGLRIDHIDGLRDPGGYLQRLRERLRRAAPGRHIVVLVEKILGFDEELPADWPVDGTTGYDFLAASANLIIDRAGALRLRERARQGADFRELAVEAKTDVARTVLRPELSRLARLFWEVSRRAGVEQPGDAEPDEAIVAISARLPVYRTYGGAGALAARDRALIEAARDSAAADGVDPELVGRVAAVLLREPPFDAPAACEAAREFLERWQQFTGPLAAKGVEDTALYRDTAFVAINDVGCEPVPVDDPLRAVRRIMAHRTERGFAALNATSTHDTKRGEDTRVRIAAISRTPAEWLSSVERWRLAHARLRATLRDGPAPGEADEQLLYQTFFGLAGGDGGATSICRRVRAYLRKAAREAKVRTSWTDPDEAYESALDLFAERVMSGPEGEACRAELGAYATANASGDLADSLRLLLLRTLAPGVPDTYQGAELWDLSLVDPDNRAPVDFQGREATLGWLSTLWGSSPPRGVRASMRLGNLGAPKMLVLWRALACRRWLLGSSEAADGVRLNLDHIDRSAGVLAWVVSAREPAGTDLGGVPNRIPPRLGSPRRILVLSARPGRHGKVPGFVERVWRESGAMLDQLSGSALAGDAADALASLSAPGSLPCAVVAVGESQLVSAEPAAHHARVGSRTA